MAMDYKVTIQQLKRRSGSDYESWENIYEQQFSASNLNVHKLVHGLNECFDKPVVDLNECQSSDSPLND